MQQLMISELEQKDIIILDVYVCPHHWDDNCKCRKPKAGLFYRIAKEYFLRMDKTFYIGDDVRDCEAAYNAGCGSVLIASKQDFDLVVNKPDWIINASKLSSVLPELVSFMNRIQE